MKNDALLSKVDMVYQLGMVRKKAGNELRQTKIVYE